MFISSWYYAIVAMVIAGMIYKYIEYHGYVAMEMYLPYMIVQCVCKCVFSLYIFFIF